MRRFNQTNNKASRAGNSSLADRFGSTSPSPPPPAAAATATAKKSITQGAHIPEEDNEKQADRDGKAPEEEEEEEDDYMSMTFADAPAAPETSLQRRERLKKEGLKRGLVPSKAELAAQERARREEGLSRPLIPLPPPPTATTTTTAKNDTRSAAALASAAARKSKGLAMMAKMGFRPGTSLGATGEARAEPLPIEVREDRGGVGLDGERKRRLREAAEAAEAAEGEEDEVVDEEGNVRKRRRMRTKGPVVVDEGDYRARMARERDAARKEKLVRAAQKIAERMDEDGRCAGAEGGGALDAGEGEGEGEGATSKEEGKRGTKMTSGSSLSSSSRPLRSLPVLYRALVRDREAAERDRRMRHDMEVSSAGARLPTYEDETMDADDRLAMGVGVGGGSNMAEEEEEGGQEEEEEEEGGRKNKNMMMNRRRVVTEVAADDLDDEDAELEAFEALGVDERLGRLVGYLRERYRYCFWCKFAYPDEGMKGCPGTTEEDHD